VIISIHLPKTAGVSFSASLKEHFGPQQYLEDYNDWPINTPRLKRNSHAIKEYLSNHKRDFSGIGCIHGHFLPLKYLGVNKRWKVEFVTWMREPVQRLVSHYHYWRRVSNPEKDPPLHRKMAEEDWSLERFCLGKEVRNIYSVFLWRFPLEKFRFIGITEYYDEDSLWFGDHLLNAKLEIKAKNVNSNIGDKYIIEDGLYEEIIRWHRKDIMLYEEALRIREVRMGSIA